VSVAPAGLAPARGDLDRRLAALAEATGLAEGRLEADAIAAARGVLDKAGARLGFGIEQTVVALAGSTGVGKSLLFNALTHTEVAAVGRRRPTTSSTQAAVWGDDADALLDWLEVGRRHQLEGGDLEGLVLLDLPDFDSVEVSHRDEVDRVVALADLVLWIVEPQKYADAALHERYLRPLAAHAAATAVVLNQADLLSREDVVAWRKDLQRLIAEGGLRDVPLPVVSARTGEGVGAVRDLLRERVSAREAAVARLAADLKVAAGTLAVFCDDGRAAGVGETERGRLQAALEEAAGLEIVVQAVADSHRRRGTLATGWPFVRWVRRLRPDPLRRLRLPDRPQPAGRTSLPPPTQAQRAQVATAARRLADDAARGLPSPWPRLVREAATTSEDRVADRVERGVAAADLRVTRPRWWSVAGFVQRVLAAAAAVGMVWLLALAVLGYLRVDDVVPLPELGGIPLPTWLLLGGVAAGIVFALLARWMNKLGARRRSRRAARALRAELEAAARELVVAPVERELDAYARFCAAVDAARSEWGGFGLQRLLRRQRRAG
jgi:GTP-binding protein EngB required for normal cell division